MTEHGLKAKEVDSLPHVSKSNPYYKSAADMKLYLLADVIKKAGSRDVERIQELKKKAAEKRRLTAETKKKQREEELVEALAEMGLTLRCDSDLCESYIEGGGGLAKDWSLESIVKEMALMKYLHEYTDYAKATEIEVEDLRDQCGYYYEGIWREAAEYVRSRYAKPSVWPWLATQPTPS
jgi:hypothetical protein